MLRKVVGGFVLLGLGAYLWFGTSVGSYMKTAYVQSVSYFKGQVPIEFEIERAKGIVAELGPDIQKAARDIVVEEVRLNRLKDEIAKSERDLREQELVIKTLRDQLKSGLASYTVGRREYSRADLERELNRKFRSFKRVTENVSQKKELLDVREGKLASAREAYQGLLETKKELESEIETLDSQHRMQEAKRVAARKIIDEGQFDDARRALEDIRERLAVDQKLLEEDGYMADPIPVEDLPPANLTDEIDAFFNTSGKVEGTST